ncbi:hypothetical protein [Streptomyces chumphonensis]|uniref:hypothetical protein n=1 Tax=Streptomyces chumphonensis TaxID=1214925 RepID=UPI0030B48FF9
MIPQSNAVEEEKAEPTSSTVQDLAELISRTLPESGMDRMTRQRVEEVLAVPALTAHI